MERNYENSDRKSETLKQIAISIGYSNSSRAVANPCAKNPKPNYRPLS